MVTFLAATQASTLMDVLTRLGQVFYFIVLPMLLLMAIGLVNQLKLKLDLRTLAKLNFNLAAPGIVYGSLVSSQVSAAEVAQVLLFGFCMLAAMAVVTYIVARIRKVPPDIRNVMLSTTIFHNSGNYGLPLQDLAFRGSGLGAAATSLQAFYMIVQNVANFTIGVVLAASGRKDSHWRQNLALIAKFPPIYALAAALITIQIRSALGSSAPAVQEMMRPFWQVIEYIRGAFVAIALFTLGAQMGSIGRRVAAYPIKTSLVLRLLVGPVVALGLIYLLGLRGLLAQMMFIAASTPTAVNTLLLSMEFDNHPDYAARAVVYSTALSPLTVTLVIFLSQSGLLPGFAIV